MTRQRRNVWRTIALGAIALVAGSLLGGAAFAVIGSNATINGCVGPNGQLRVVDDGARCKDKETSLSWNTQGPPGPAGASAPAPLTAAVRLDGTLVRGSATYSKPNARGVPGYVGVGFDRDVSQCFYTATIGDPESSASTLTGSIAASKGDLTNEVLVTTSVAGPPDRLPFFLVVTCPN